jgi:uncharacterized protein YbjT (DUF2867 family)
MKYLITGATGDVGSRVVSQLLKVSIRPRIFVRDEKKARTMFGDQVEISLGNLADATSLKAALQNIDKLFLVTTGPQIPTLDETAAKTAKAAGVRHLVKLSTLDVRQGLAIGIWHERGEDAIRATGIPFTFLQPTGFMSNLLAWAHSIKSEGVVRSSTGEGRRAFIHSDDIAAIAARVLTTSANDQERTKKAGNDQDSCEEETPEDETYIGKSLALTGPEALTFAEVTSKISAAIGTPLTFQPISDAEARQRYSAATGAEEEETEAHVALWRAIREGRLAVVTDEVDRILGRKPMGLDQWAAENAQAFR